MAFYKDILRFVRSEGMEFDDELPPGEPAPYSGIYRCTSCGREIGIAGGNRLPPEHHISHREATAWQLIVKARHTP